MSAVEPSTEPTGLDLVTWLQPNHKHLSTCVHCGEECATTAITRLAYVFEQCECGDPEYPHIVERLIHVECMAAGFIDVAARELLTSASWALERNRYTAQRQSTRDRILAFLVRVTSSEAIR